MKTEIWNDNEIRFVEVDNEWWAVLKDVTDALGLNPKHVKERLDDEVVSTDHVLDSLGRKQSMTIVNEFGVYDTIFSSRKKEAKEFKRWAFNVIKELREQTGLEGFQVFRMLDKEHQKEAMSYLNHTLKNPVRVNFIKANTITNKAVSLAYGYPKMLKKDEMTPQMLADRQKRLVVQCSTDEEVVKRKLWKGVEVNGIDVASSLCCRHGSRHGLRHVGSG